MTNVYPHPRVTGKYIAVTFIAVVLTWLLHELAHYAVGEYLGYHMVMTLNSTYPVTQQYAAGSMHSQLISGAGPLFTLFEAIVIFMLMLQRRRLLLYPFIFTCFYMRLLAAIISVFNPNDEARISMAAGLGKFTLPVCMVLILGGLVYVINKKYQLGARFNAATTGLVMLFSSAVILADMFCKVHLL